MKIKALITPRSTLTLFPTSKYNNARLDELASKLSTFRNVNQEIDSQARADLSMMDEIQNSFGSMYSNLRNSSSRLARSMKAGNNIWKMVGVALAIFFLTYGLFKVF
ncbi:LAMI_0G03664g1_1 [Lachancea mirantina]|uniref:LAMI_0G03664g1_1 n=1 Tax=Lachancea mirantina TaxID=1230905 RepID=A0A1G4K8B7_9SACH|nr:LAMI_0G03664g1_1 [Lachancea mirantina]